MASCTSLKSFLSSKDNSERTTSSNTVPSSVRDGPADSADAACFGFRIAFSRMRSKGSRFTLGVWGLRVCSLDVAFTSATVRNRPYELRMAVPMGSFAEVVLFGGFRRLVASFRVAGVALRDIQTCSATCRKSLRVAGAILLRHFQKMCCSFRGRRSMDVSIVIFRGRRSTLDVSFCVFFCKSHWPGLRQVVTRCKFRGRRGIFSHVLKIDGSLARNIDFDVTNFQVLRKTRRIMRFVWAYPGLANSYLFLKKTH